MALTAAVLDRFGFTQSVPGANAKAERRDWLHVGFGGQVVVRWCVETFVVGWTWKK
jgi:hypothetical protein